MNDKELEDYNLALEDYFQYVEMCKSIQSEPLGFKENWRKDRDDIIIFVNENLI